MRRVYPAVVLLILASLFGCGGSHSASLTPQSSLSGAAPASASRSALSSTIGSAADVAAALPPTTPIKVAPYAVALVTAGQTQTITVSEPGYSGSFTATSSDPTIATVSPVVSGQATVTAVAQGATSLIVVDQLKPQHKTKVPVTVGLAQFALEQFRSPSTLSITILANGQRIFINLAVPPSGCTHFSASCTLSVPEIAGLNTFVFTLSDETQMLSTATVSAQINSPSDPQTFKVPLGGVVSALKIALGNPTPPPGTPATSAVNITALDADANPITGTASYVNSSGTKLSVSIADSDTSGITSVKPKTVSKPSALPVLSYNGAALPSGATITVSAPGVSPVTALFAPVGASKIYVLNPGNNTLTTYNADGSASTPTITAGLNVPYGVAVDTAGKIYVANFVNNGGNTGTLTTYNADGSPSTPTITGLNGPVGVAVDSAGKIYVANINSSTVTTYNADGTQATPTITTGLNRPFGVAVGAAGKIYVLNNGTLPGTLTTYNADGSPSTPTISAGLIFPGGVAVDAAGKIYVVNQCDQQCGANTGTLTTYNADGSPSTPTITGLNHPYGVAVDAAGKIYVGNIGNGTVTTYNADGSASTPTITGLNEPYGYGIAVH
jgi:hypothetical protein